MKGAPIMSQNKVQRDETEEDECQGVNAERNQHVTKTLLDFFFFF